MQDMTELGREIADALGGWSVEPLDPRSRCYLVGQNEGERLFILAENHDPNSLIIKGDFPDVQDCRGNGRNVRIGCSRTKGAARIAKDIERRLLPDYRVALAAVLEFRDRQAGNTAQRELAMTEVSAKLGGPRVMTDGYFSSEVNLGGVLVRGYGSITATSGADTMTLDLKAIPRDVAMQIVVVLAEARNADRGELLS
jgi:hypothetical protein